MGTRKRNKEKGESTNHSDLASKKILVPPQQSSTSPTLAALFLVLLVLVTGGIYVYNFVDVHQVWDTYVVPSAGSTTESPLAAKAGAPQGGPTTSRPPTTTESPTPPPYKKASITNSNDEKIKESLDAADDLLERGDAERALKKFEKILAKNPNSPRAQYGKALSYNALAEIERSNPRLEQGIAEMSKLMDWQDIPKDLMYTIGKKLADRQQFRGWGSKALVTMQKLSKMYPDDRSLENEIGMRYMMLSRNEDARNVFNSVLKKAPNDGYAKVHLGFIIKTVDRNYAGAIPFLQEGIDTRDEGTMDGRFFFHLGDAYHRVGKPEKAKETYQVGAEHKLFMSAYQRSLYNVENIKAQPWWTMEETGNAKHLKTLEKNWKTIRDEGMAQLDPKTGSFVPEEEDLRESGDWKQLTLFQQGRKNAQNCKRAPKTCALVEKFTEAAGCKRGQVKFSVMHPGVHVWPHCGPTNCRIRAHLGLVVPEGPRIRVAEDTRGWKEGEFIIFDDSFEHEVWHDGDSTRLVLIVDMWHPELTDRQKQTLTPI